MAYRELVVSPRTRRTQAVEDSGLRVIQIREPQNDPATRWHPVLFAHIGGFHTAGMHKLDRSFAESLGMEKCTGDNAPTEHGYERVLQ